VIVLDASVLIAYLDGRDTHHEAAEALFIQTVDDDLAINSLTLAEVLVGPTREGRLDAALAVLRDLEVRELAFPAETAVRLARIRASTGLRMPDCCVMLAAEDNAATLATFDRQLGKVAAGLDVPVLPR
jgi:predicted nucleic acid-binding protein